MALQTGFMKYVKKAFLYHWNLLFFGAGAVIGVISGRPDIVFPLVGAAELAYLAALSTHTRFQDAIDAEENKNARLSKTDEAIQKSQMILSSLSRDDRRRYERLKSLCIQLRRIAQGIKIGPDRDAVNIDDLQKGGINHLLWIYLKLLYSKGALEKFFSTINEQEIEMDIQRAKDKIVELGPPEEDTPTEVKMRKSLDDTLKTSEMRLKNYNLAKENYGFIELELDRLYSKIASLGEMSINRQDPDFISSEVDSVSASVHQTEKAMNDLQFITGLTPQDEAPPSLLEDEQIEIG